MLFRVLVVLTGAIGVGIAAIIYPFFGLLALVVLNFARPQDDRPNILALRIPMVMLIAVMVGILFRFQSILPALIDGIKRMRIMLLLAALITVSVVVNYSEQAWSGLNDF